MNYFLSLSPIFLLILISLVWDVKRAVWLGLLFTAILFFYWQASSNAFVASLVAAFSSTLSILMIVFGALLLYKIMNGNSYEPLPIV